MRGFKRTMETKIIDGVLCEIRQLERGKNYHSEHGRSSFIITCPFCNQEIEVYAWSFAGCGRNCDCGAKISSYRFCWKKITEVKPNSSQE